MLTYDTSIGVDDSTSATILRQVQGDSVMNEAYASQLGRDVTAVVSSMAESSDFTSASHPEAKRKFGFE